MLMLIVHSPSILRKPRVARNHKSARSEPFVSGNYFMILHLEFLLTALIAVT